ncbi:MAG: DUF983 domain-containing protein [Flavobacteriales bacterium]|nr:MAG: DUF983 domain-containing protein [Flavobacteriales bacterium]PIE49695.1 MAG: DUF983 domain-containing protein [Flavobacteriales bacterium]
MFKKGSKLYSILFNKCPKCHQGRFFEDDNPFHLKKVLKTNVYCEKCGFKYQIEPSFFYGAMYVSYALSVAFSIITFIVLYLIGVDILTIFILLFVLLVIFTPYTLRYARLIYANMFIHYDKEIAQSVSEK